MAKPSGSLIGWSSSTGTSRRVGTQAELAASPAVSFGAPPGLDITDLATVLVRRSLSTRPAATRWRRVLTSAHRRIASWLAAGRSAFGPAHRPFVGGHLPVHVGERPLDGLVCEPGVERRTSAGAENPVTAYLAQARAETFMTLRRGETLLLTVGIPVVFLSSSRPSTSSRPDDRGGHLHPPGILASP